jgi:hypothetical protein
LNEIEVNDWLKPTFKKTLFDDKKDGFRHKLFEKAKKLDKDVIDRMKLRMSEAGGNNNRELAAIVGAIPKQSNKNTPKPTDLTERDSMDMSKNKSSYKKSQ